MCALPVPLLDHLDPVQDDLSRDELRDRNGAETRNMLITTPAPDRVGKHGSRLQGGLAYSSQNVQIMGPDCSYYNNCRGVYNAYLTSGT